MLARVGPSTDPGLLERGRCCALTGKGKVERVGQEWAVDMRPTCRPKEFHFTFPPRLPALSASGSLDAF